MPTENSTVDADEEGLSGAKGGLNDLEMSRMSPPSFPSKWCCLHVHNLR